MDVNVKYSVECVVHKRLPDNVEAQASLIEDYIFIKRYKGTMTDDKLAGFIREQDW